MNRFEIVTRKKSVTKKKVAAFVEKVKELGQEMGLTVELKIPETGSSRADRLQAAMSDVENAATEVESLKDELQEWYDNLPESFQNGDKGTALQEAIDSLESLQDDLGNAKDAADGIEFPGMY